MNRVTVVRRGQILAWAALGALGHAIAASAQTNSAEIAGVVRDGSAPRNSVVGPGYANVDFALARAIALRGQSQLELRWEVFNLLNQTNFDQPSRVFGTPNFGRIFSAKSARAMQFGARIAF